MFQNNLLMGAASTASAGGFSIDNSCLFNTSDNAVLSRANGTATSSKIATIAFWFKIGVIGVDRAFFGAEGFYTGCAFLATGQLYVVHGSGAIVLTTTQIFKDPTAWYHCVCVFDTTEAATEDRFKMYINGVQVTAYTSGTFPTLNEAFTAWNQSGNTNLVGDGHSTYANYDGYLSEFHSIDGTAYGPTTFGEFDDNGVWRPIEVSAVTYGNNGFYMDFKDSSNLGNDVSGNDNDLTSSGLVAADQFNDTPTNNYCIFNSVNIGTLSGAAPTLSEGGTVLTGPGSTYGSSTCTVGIPTSGKYWFKATLTVAAGGGHLGIVSFGNSGWSNAQCAASQVQSSTLNFDLISCGYFHDVLHRFNGGASVVDVGESSSLSVDDVFEFLIDRDSGDVTINLNGSLHVTVESLPSTQVMFPFASGYAGSQWTIDCGGNGSTPSDTDFKDINTTNMPTPTILDGTANFQTTLYTGNATDRNISQTENSVFTPDWVWIKNRSAADEHKLIDITRGVAQEISSDSNTIESTNLDGLQAFSDKLWVDASGETLIGNSTSAGGLAAAFDGDNSKGYATCAAAGSPPGTVGVDWGSGNTKLITQMIIVGSSDYGYSSNGRTINIKLEGSTDNFSSSVVDLGGGTGDFTDASSNSFKLITPTSTTAYRYHRAYITSSVGSTNVAQVQLFESNTGAARGFTLGNGPSGYNDNSENFVAWQWLAGGGAGSSNEVGSINTTTTTVNTTAGISISTYVGTGSTATVGHGLGAVPALMVFKNIGAEENWRVYHKDNTAAPETEYLSWTNNGATADLATTFNDTAPTSTVFTVGSSAATNQSGETMIAYIFAEIEGFSNFGGYTGNGLALGATVYTGFKPAYIIIKKSSGTGSWVIYDNQRSPYNEIDDQLLADTTAAETTGSEEIDFLANGFKIKTADSDVNTANGLYVYAAFAEYPFGGEDVTPATAF